MNAVNKAAERRADERFEYQDQLSVKIVFSSENPSLLGKSVEGSTLDISASGLRIELNQSIEIDSVLDVWVNLKNLNKKFFLTGNVRWVNETAKPGTYQIGLVLRERTDTVTDLSSWKATIKKHLSE